MASNPIESKRILDNVGDASARLDFLGREHAEDICGVGGKGTPLRAASLRYPVAPKTKQNIVKNATAILAYDNITLWSIP